MEQTQVRPRENVPLGAMGAFVGSLLGVACIVLGCRTSYVSIVSGVVMSMCTLKGYEMLGGRLGKAGAVISALMILVMTYFANDLCATFEIMDAVDDIGFFEAYQNIDAYVEAKVVDGHWGQLLFLYLLDLAGATPMMFSHFKKRAPAEKRPHAEGEGARSKVQGTFYVLQKDWMSRLRLSMTLPLLTVFAVDVAVWLVASSLQRETDTFPIVAGGFFCTVILFCMALPTLQLCGSVHIVYVRVSNRLWRVNLQEFCSGVDWERGLSTQQEVIKEEILSEIQCLMNGEMPGCSPGTLVELKNLQVEKETRWSWKVSYETAAGRRKKLAIGKGYPNFVPARGMEKPQGPVPGRWSFSLIALVLTAVLMAPGCITVLRPDAERPEPTSRPTLEPEPTVEPVHIPARVPETITEYEMSEIWFRMDSTFQAGRRIFLDGETGTLYWVYTQHGVDTGDAWDTLTQTLKEYQNTADFDHDEAVYMGDDRLAQRNQSSRYNIVSVYLTDGQVLHTAAVLSEDGTLFTLEAEHNTSKQSVDDVLANLMYTVESVRFTGPAVTEENYQSKIHVSEVRDCEFMAAAYIKTDIFGHNAFVDVYVPYSDQPIYTTDGRAIRSEAHGLRVYVTILPGESAKEVIDAQQQALAATGRVYEDGVDDELYREDMDAACKLTVYEENGQKRYAVLYADPKWEGYYLFREFTGLPELVDEDYPAALAELERLSGLTVPALEALGKPQS